LLNPIGAPGERGGASAASNRPATVGKPERPEAGTEGRVVVVGDGTPDPREQGLNYVIVFREAREKARAAAEFLAERGHEVAMVPSGRNLFIVVSLRGFEGSVREGDGRRHFEELRQLGRAFRRSGGSGDFASAYWDRFDG